MKLRCTSETDWRRLPNLPKAIFLGGLTIAVAIALALLCVQFETLLNFHPARLPFSHRTPFQEFLLYPTPLQQCQILGVFIGWLLLGMYYLALDESVETLSITLVVFFFPCAISPLLIELARFWFTSD